MPGVVGGNREPGDARKGPEELLGEADAVGYRRPLPGFSMNAPELSANDAAGQGFSPNAGITGGMDKLLAEGDARRLPDLGIALKSILGFWLL
jgi:hypothetical protein